MHRFVLRLSALLAPALIAQASSTSAHDWYPLECCHHMDCAPVDHVERPSDGQLVVTSRHGTGIVPKDMTRRHSQDSRMHVCMQRGGEGRMRVICLFVPPLI